MRPICLVAVSLLVAALLAGILSGCGGASQATAAGQHGATTQIDPPPFTKGSPPAPGDGPVTTVIMLDRTPLLDGDESLAANYVQAAMRFAMPTIGRGGRLVVQAFGRVSGIPLTLLSMNLPTLRQAGPAARDDAGQARLHERAARVGVGLDGPPTAAVARALARLTDSTGSDIARAVGAGIATAASGGTTRRNVLILTDGWAFEAGSFSLRRFLASRPPSAAAAELARVARSEIPSGARSSLLWIVGLGSTAGEDDPTPTKLDELVKTWNDVCPSLPVDTCAGASGS
jgi:hypothetical protein